MNAKGNLNQLRHLAKRKDYTQEMKVMVKWATIMRSIMAVMEV
jgi:hypothetical protein